MKKTIDQIRQETPLSVTTTDNAIYRCIIDVNVYIYDTEVVEGMLYRYNTLQMATIQVNDLLRLLQCNDDETPNHYRWGDGSQSVIIPDFYMEYVSGHLGTRV